MFIRNKRGSGYPVCANRKDATSIHGGSWEAHVPYVAAVELLHHGNRCSFALPSFLFGRELPFRSRDNVKPFRIIEAFDPVKGAEQLRLFDRLFRKDGYANPLLRLDRVLMNEDDDALDLAKEPRIEWKQHIIGTDPLPFVEDSDLVVSVFGPLSYGGDVFEMLKMLKPCGRLYSDIDAMIHLPNDLPLVEKGYSRQGWFVRRLPPLQ